MKRLSKILLFCITCLVFISCDRVTKELAKDQLKNQPAKSFMHDTIRLEYAENTGAALSLGDTLSPKVSFWLLSILPLIFLTGVCFYTIKNVQHMSPMKVFSLALLFAGGIGNIVDRVLFDRHVTDFMIVGFWQLRTGIFNVADVCVTAGAIGLLVFYKTPENESRIPA